MFIRLTLVLFASLLAAARSDAHANIIIVPNDSPGTGLNDATMVMPVAGNPGSTLGAQRLYVMQKAADQWGAMLESSVPIRVNAHWNMTTCNASTTSLGSAGAAAIFSNFSNAPRADTWYVAALADALAGVDLDPTAYDINAQFNPLVDAGCIAGITGWWYGVDPAVAPPVDRIALLPVLLHEFAHALGFVSLTNASTGAYYGGAPGRPDTWAYFLRDTTTGLTWNAMTAAQRQASAINDPHLVWSGPNVNRVQRAYLRRAVQLSITAPAQNAGDIASIAATIGPPVSATGLAGEVVLVQDGVAAPGGSANDACEALTNAAALAGKIALIDRGRCKSVDQLLRVQAAGAIGALIANNTTGLAAVGGTGPLVIIPSLGITKADGATLRNAQSPAVSMHPVAALAGTQDGCVRMHAPSPIVSGVSVSHFSLEATPNLLMEPSADTQRLDQTDLTLALLQDIGWSTHPGDLLFFDDFDPNPCAAISP